MIIDYNAAMETIDKLSNGNADTKDELYFCLYDQYKYFLFVDGDASAINTFTITNAKLYLI